MPTKKPKVRGRPPGPRSGFGEVGFSGLLQTAGVVTEEWMPQLRGAAGVRAIKTMVGTDATVSAVMTAAKMAVRQVRMFVEPASPTGGEPTQADIDCADHVTKCLFDYMGQSWAENMTEILTCMDFGWSWKEKVYEKHAETGTIIWKHWGFRPQETLDMWGFDPKTGELQGMWQVVTAPTYNRTLIPKEKSLHFTLNSTKGNPEGVSLLRGAYMAWFAKHKLELIELIGIERNLAGLPDIKIPAVNFAKKNRAVLDKYTEIAKKVHRNEDAYIITPSDVYPGTQTPLYSVGLVGGQQLTTRGTGLPTIQPIERYQQEIARCLLADFMLLPAGGPGSYALSSNKSSFFVMFIEGIVDAIIDIINKQAIPELVDMNNFGAITDYPKLKHDNVATTDIADLGRLLSNLYKSGAEMFPDDNLRDTILQEAGLPKGTLEQQAKQEFLPGAVGPDGQPIAAPTGGAAGGEGTTQGRTAAQAAAGLPLSPAQVGSQVMKQKGTAAAAKIAGAKPAKAAKTAKTATTSKPPIKPKKKPAGGGA